ncbi:MAG: glycerol-3-phosphate dehydrogenase [Calditrichaeota bacterium]|nr:MAG: glycerol-3-phosphate dehydrogenase [Calditrichota bacterium]MBL1207772.1 glycerol-3-phosphate dehydrogenase [Calditrichota bacterium]NOG47605.1 glycerol-3-phosphate dehydrogenase [Calditrichota bacterium]
MDKKNKNTSKLKTELPGISMEFSAKTRKGFIKKLQSEQFDILIIGGGITGAGIARDAALRGYRTALIEKDDFAAGTSSKSSKLIHGGIRYLQHMEFGLVHEALLERKTLMDIAPHLVHPIEVLFPVYKGSSVPAWMVKIGMLLYDGLSFSKRIGLHRLIPIGKNDKPERLLLKKGLEKLFMYYDSRADDTRLVMANIQSAALNSAITANYIKAVDVIQEDGQVKGLKVQDQLSGKKFEVNAHLVCNATGPWNDFVRGELFNDNKQRLRPTKGIHFVVRRKDLDIKRTMILSTIQDERPVFVIPWREFVILGTTDTYFEGDPDWVDISVDDVDYLLESYNHYFPKANLTKDKVLSVYSGLRPLTLEEGKSAGEVTREYQIFEGPQNFFNILGGKLTTYRTMAEEMVNRLGNALSDHLGILARNSKCTTDKLPLNGGDIKNYEQFESEWTEKLIRNGFEKDTAKNLIESYGENLSEALTIISSRKNGTDKIINNLPYLWGEIDYCCHYEMTLALDDFLMRRTHLFSLDPNQAQDVHLAVADRMAEILDWSGKEKKRQIENYKKKVEMVQSFRVGAVS